MNAVLRRPESEVYAENARAARNEGRDKNRLHLETAAAVIGAIVAFATLGQLILTSRAVQIAAISADAAKKSAAMSERQAKITQESIESSIEDFHLEQRAWVGPDQPTSVKPSSSISGGYDVTVPLKNTGKTPAFNVSIETNNAFEGAGKPFKDVWWCPKDTSKESSEILLQPNGITLATTHYPPMYPNCKSPTTTDDWLQFTQGNKRWYIFGRIQYEDVFRCQHTTHWCKFFEKGDLNRAYSCTTYNDADRNTCSEK